MLRRPICVRAVLLGTPARRVKYKRGVVVPSVCHARSVRDGKRKESFSLRPAPELQLADSRATAGFKAQE